MTLRKKQLPDSRLRTLDNFINKVEDNSFFQLEKCLILIFLYCVPWLQKYADTFGEKPQLKIVTFQNYKYGYLILNFQTLLSRVLL